MRPPFVELADAMAGQQPFSPLGQRIQMPFWWPPSSQLALTGQPLGKRQLQLQIQTFFFTKIHFFV